MVKVKRIFHKWTAWDYIVHILMIAITAIIIFPFINVIAVSLSSEMEYYKNPMMIWPKGFSYYAYQNILSNASLWRGYSNTIIVTMLGTALSLFLSVTLAYPLSRKDFRGRKLCSGILTFTMLFNGGLIPNFMLIKSIGLFNTMGALIIPASLSAYNCILIRSFFQTIPGSLVESATIDGATDLNILVSIILPLSKPILATMTLFHAVTRWNSFFSSIIYTKDKALWTLQLVLRELLMASRQSADVMDVTQYVSTTALRYATIVVATLPILCVYPFVQKHFITGMMLGAVKE